MNITVGSMIFAENDVCKLKVTDGMIVVRIQHNIINGGLGGGFLEHETRISQ